MTNSKNTKRALLASVLSLMLCVAMLVGSTFAWFTDTVTSGKNQIVAGNLDVEMEHAVLQENGEYQWKAVDSETALFDENALWEPGYTQVVYLRVKNKGSLSLNYKLSVIIENEKIGSSIEGGEIKLSDFLNFGAVATTEEKFFADRNEARAALGENVGKLKNYSTTGSIKASEKDTDIDYLALVIYMPEDVGNEANYNGNLFDSVAIPSINLGIKLEATQMVDEADSFDNTYDENAFQADDAFTDMTDQEFTLTNAKDLLKFADLVLNGNTFEGKTVMLGNDITLAIENWKPIGAKENPFKGTFDGNGYTISGLQINKNTPGERYEGALFNYVDGATIKNLTLEGEFNIILTVILPFFSPF